MTATTKAKEFLAQYAQNKGWPTEDEDLVQTLMDAGKIIHREGRDEHRWYINETVVYQIGEVYIQFPNYVITGDNSASDMGLEYDIDDAQLVERKERTVTEVYFAPDDGESGNVPAKEGK